MNLAIAHLTAPAQGEVESGDAVVVRREPDATLLAVIDALGHGPEAAKVATRAVEHLGRAPLGPAAAIMTGLHDALRGTRGAAASLCVVRRDRLDGCGVGNVEVRVTTAPIAALLTPGILGHQIRSLRTFEGRLRPGDRVVCFSDGISSRVALADLQGLTPRAACDLVMQRHRRGHDDASVLIADLEAGS